MTILKGVELLALLEAVGVLVELQPASASAAAVTTAGMAINLFETTLFPLIQGRQRLRCRKHGVTEQRP
jgi:hypothetical protein